jgi:hypothetical protein
MAENPNQSPSRAREKHQPDNYQVDPVCVSPTCVREIMDYGLNDRRRASRRSSAPGWFWREAGRDRTD